VRAPIAFVYGNCVFAEGLDDVWAAFAVGVSSYEWLSEEGKRVPFLALIGALEAIEADVQIVRVGRRWPVERYASECSGEGDATSCPAPHLPHARARRRYVEEHVRRLAELGSAQPAVFLMVSLRDPERDVASYVSQAAAQHPREWWEGLRRTFSIRDRRLLKVSELERARVRADQAHARLAEMLSVRQARGVELQWLVRRAFCRGLGEPVVDGLHEPRALTFERNGEAMLAPLEGDVLRWGSLVAFRWFLSRPDSRLCCWDPQQSLMSGASALAGIQAPLEVSSRGENPKNTRVRGSLKIPSARHRPGLSS
jgi:hypothetical protein